MELIARDSAHIGLNAVAGAFLPSGGFDQLQQAVFEAIATDVLDIDLVAHPILPLTADDFLAHDPDEALRTQAVCLMAVLEMVAHPLSTQTADDIKSYARALGVKLRVLDAARALARNHALTLHADFQRSSWYTKETIHGSLHGQFTELCRSKLSYMGVGTDAQISRRWNGLRDLPQGSWGRGVVDFYERYDFPFPGTRHGIYEIGARHDFIHVLADYEATPEGEIDVFGFIAASMPLEAGTVLLAVTLSLFQNGSIHHVAGKKVRLARSDTLSDDGAVDRFADALRRGSLTTADMMGGIDHFALAPLPLDEARARLHVVDKRF